MRWRWRLALKGKPRCAGCAELCDLLRESEKERFKQSSERQFAAQELHEARAQLKDADAALGFLKLKQKLGLR